jgi:hypothetical protein
MDKTLLRARIEEILDEYDSVVWDDDVKDELVEQLVAEVTKVGMEELFDAEEPEESDELDQG